MTIVEKTVSGVCRQEHRGEELEINNIPDILQVVVDQIPDVLLLVDKAFNVIWMNLAARKLLRQSFADELTGGNISLYHFWFDAPEAFPFISVRQTFAIGEQQEEVFDDIRGLTWGLKVFPPIAVSTADSVAIIIASDVTEKIQLRAEAFRAGQMAMLCQLAAGVAHEINNPINVIINYAQLIADRSTPESEEHQLSADIIVEGARIADITNNLLTFARDQHSQRTPAAPCDLVRSTMMLAESQLCGEGIEILIDIPDNLPTVLVQKEQVQQLFLNLLNNARHALDRKFSNGAAGKILSISARRVLVNARIFVRFEFMDNGTGIKKENLDKIFDPFYTTKPNGKGTGLGLSVSKGIVKSHGGQITIRTEADSYTQVVFDFPAHPGGEEFS